jgi:hypothetical protein
MAMTNAHFVLGVVTLLLIIKLILAHCVMGQEKFQAIVFCALQQGK